MQSNNLENAHNRKRREKVHMILATAKKFYESAIEGEETGIDEKKLISLVCLEFGAGSRYVKEVIKDLQNAGYLTIQNKKIYYIPQGVTENV